MKIIRNRFIPFGNFAAINLFGIMLVKHHVHISPQMINHESIHTAQMRELLFLPFYLLYIMEWILRLFQTCNPRKAYYAISFEKEAYANDSDLNYLTHRKPFAQWRKM